MKYTEETIPAKIFNRFGMINSILQIFGVFIAYVLGELLPDDDNKVELK